MKINIDYKRVFEGLGILLDGFMVGDVPEKEKEKHDAYRLTASYRKMIQDIEGGRYDIEQVISLYSDTIQELRENKNSRNIYIPEEIEKARKF